MDIAALERSELRRAFKFAREVNQLMTVQEQTILTRLQSDLSDIVLETIECINNNTLLHTNCLNRISRYLTMDKEAKPLLKLGYALTVVIEKLMNDRAEYMSMDYIEQPSTSRPVVQMQVDAHPRLFDDHSDIKTEPVDIKEEPLDDYDQVKQEELDGPEADVFCPSTGASRPLGSMRNGQNGHLPGQDDGRVWVGMRSEQPLPTTLPAHSRANKVYAVRKGPGKNIMKRVTLPVATIRPTPALMQAKTGIRCYLCCANNLEKYETTPPHTQVVKRKKFLDKIVTNSVAGKDRLDLLRRSHQTAHFCELHFNLPPAYKKVNKKSSCELCDQPRYPLAALPTNPITRRRFIASLIKLSVAQQKKIEFLQQNADIKATFCAKHFNKYDAQREGEIRVSKIPEYLEQLKHQHSSRKKAKVDAPAASIPAIDMDILLATPVRIDVGYPNEAPVKEEPIPDPIVDPIVESIPEPDTTESQEPLEL